MDPIVRWLLQKAPNLDLEEIVAELIVRADAEGVPIDRIWASSRVLHPLFGFFGWSWTRGERLQIDFRKRAFLQTVAVRASAGAGPPAAIVFGAPEYRHRLDEGPLPFTVLEELRDQGFTDYVIWPGPIPPDPERLSASMCAWATKRPGGFSDAQLDRLRGIHDAVALLQLRQQERFLARTIAQTYLGRNAGDRVLDGEIWRGDVQRIRAAILFTDLRGFTAMSERASPEEVMDWLNDAFDAQVEAIEAHGGEVLAFMGDGLLAIFQDAEDTAACAGALAATHAIAEAVAARNAGREGKEPIRYGAALHHGTVSYGNFGAEHRLDFTVNGPAVNQAARLEALGAQLGLCPILSGPFAERCGAPVRLHGRYDVKGVDGLEAWVLDD